MVLLRRSALAALALPALLVACAAGGDPTKVTPNEVASPKSACGALASWGQKCSEQASLATCGGKIVDGCADLASALNTGVVEEARTCMAGASCEDGPAKCLASAAANARPTAAHRALADAYCSKCAPQLGDACKDPATNEVLAKLTLPLADAIVDDVRERCTTTTGCAATFPACAQAAVLKGLSKSLSTETAKCVAESVMSQVVSAAPGGTKPPSGDEPPRCTPRTCQDLGATCGVHDDGCGGSVGCGVCAGSTPCQPDDNEKNDSRATAKPLGTFTDSPLSQTIVKNLTLPDGDEDWFSFRVEDKGYLGNPKITVSAKLPSIEVSAYFLCDNQNDASYCQQGTADNAIGRGCRGDGAVKLEASCSWTITDSGNVIVRVRKKAADQQCTAYDLTVAVAE
jgi:hypothetical protein